MSRGPRISLSATRSQIVGPSRACSFLETTRIVRPADPSLRKIVLSVQPQSSRSLVNPLNSPTVPGCDPTILSNFADSIAHKDTVTFQQMDQGLALLTQFVHSPFSRISLMRPIPVAFRLERAVNSIASRHSTRPHSVQTKCG